VSASALYGGTYNLFAHTLPQFGISTRFADARNPASFEPDDERTKAVFIESIGNPLGISPTSPRLRRSPTAMACR
jgi:O-acetylhomoserine (thiol)-lyase